VSARLDEKLEGSPQVLGMDERLELPQARRGPGCERLRGPLDLLHDFGQKSGLREQSFRPQAGILALLLKRAEIHVAGQILFSGASQQIGTHLVPMISAERSVGAVRREEFFSQQAIVDGQQLAPSQPGGGLSPPRFSRRRDFAGKAIRQCRCQFRGQNGPADRLPWLCLSVLSGWQFDPPKTSFFPAHSPFEPPALAGVPSESVHREGVQEFIAEEDAADALRRNRFPGTEPSKAPVELAQRFGLAALPVGRGFQNPVLQLCQ